MSFGWELLEYLPQRARPDSVGPSVFGWYLPLKEPRLIPEGARIHASVLARRAKGLPVRVRLPEHFEVEAWSPEEGQPPAPGQVTQLGSQR